MKISGFSCVSRNMAANVRPLTEVVDESGLSSLCQDNVSS